MTREREYDVAEVVASVRGGEWEPRTSDGKLHPDAVAQRDLEARLVGHAARQRRDLVDAVFDAAALDPAFSAPPRPLSEIVASTERADVAKRRAVLEEVDASVAAMQSREEMPPAPPSYRPLEPAVRADIRYRAQTFRAGGPPAGMPDFRVPGRPLHFFGTDGTYRGIAASFPPPPPGTDVEAALACHIAIRNEWTDDEMPDLDLVRWSPGGYPVLYDGDPSDERLEGLGRRGPFGRLRRPR